MIRNEEKKYKRSVGNDNERLLECDNNSSCLIVLFHVHEQSIIVYLYIHMWIHSFTYIPWDTFIHKNTYGTIYFLFAKHYPLVFFFSIRAFLINSDETPHKVDGFAGLSHSCIFLNPNNNAINLFIKKKKNTKHNKTIFIFYTHSIKYQSVIDELKANFIRALIKLPWKTKFIVTYNK